MAGTCPGVQPGRRALAAHFTAAAAPTAVDAADISGQVRVDRNADGDLSEAEEGLAGVEVGLWRDETLGLKDVGDTLVMTTTTAGGGAYSFAGLGAGDYVIVEEDLVVDKSGDPIYRYASTGDSDSPTTTRSRSHWRQTSMRRATISWMFDRLHVGQSV